MLNEFEGILKTHVRLIADAYKKAYPNAGWLHIDMDVQENRLTVFNAHYGRDRHFPVDVRTQIIPDEKEAP